MHINLVTTILSADATFLASLLLSLSPVIRSKCQTNAPMCFKSNSNSNSNSRLTWTHSTAHKIQDKYRINIQNDCVSLSLSLPRFVLQVSMHIAHCMCFTWRVLHCIRNTHVHLFTSNSTVAKHISIRTENRWNSDIQTWPIRVLLTYVHHNSNSPTRFIQSRAQAQQV